MITARWGAIATSRFSQHSLKQSLGLFMICIAPILPFKSHILRKNHNEDIVTESNLIKDYDPVDGRTETMHQRNNCRESEGTTNASTPNNSFKNFILRLERFVPSFLLGMTSGFFAGLFGVGGGAIVVPALVLLPSSVNLPFLSTNHELPHQQSQLRHVQHSDSNATPAISHRSAIGTSLCAMTIPAIVGTLTHYKRGNVALSIAPALALGSFVGSFVGGRYVVIGCDVKDDTLSYGFGGLMMLLGAKTIFKA
mmetsp:Transcript_21174/g.29661  ORF Transcript_21174/g.29661 Transcript_21174/m.29661 type:complete len:253 (-) Transcript_21174:413-1171(-)